MSRRKIWSLLIGLTLAIMFAECWTIEHDHIDDDDDDCKFQNSTTEFDRFDEKILLRKKRNFGGKEPIDFTKAFNAIFGHPGWLAQGLEAFSDINFHLLGYTALGFTYNFGEGRKNPDKVRQKYLDQFFGATAIAQSAFRALRNPLFSFALRTYLNLAFSQEDMSKFLSKMHISEIRDTLLSEPWLHAKIFRDICSLFFTSIGWTTYYVWWKWSIQQPIIAGKRKKRSALNEETHKANAEKFMEEIYQKAVAALELKDLTAEELFDEDPSKYFSVSSIPLVTCYPANSTCIAPGAQSSKGFGDYQYFLSFGGDQYLDIPLAIDAAYGTRGLIVQIGHFTSQVSFEVVGYAAMGFVYNSVYRTMISDNEARKFIDTFVGPTVSAASMMRIFRNGLFSLSTRIGLGLFIPLTRERALYLLRFFTFTLFKQTIFSELYLHQRIWRHIFENGCGIMGLSTYYAVFRYKKAYYDPPPEKKQNATTTVAPAKGSASAKKPNYKRMDYDYKTSFYNGYSKVQPKIYENEYLLGYVSINDTDDALYGLREPVEDGEQSLHNDNNPPSNHQFVRYTSYHNQAGESPQVDNEGLDAFKSAILKLKESWNPAKSSF